MIRTGMSRGIVVLDEDLLSLHDPLRRRNLRVLVAPARTDDEDIVAVWLPGRILVTNNQDDFREQAVAYEFGVIQISQKLMGDPEEVARRISREIVQRQLWSKKPFVLSLSPDRVLFVDLSDL